jgi:serine/threonine protein phosphatase PrpC
MCHYAFRVPLLDMHSRLLASLKGKQKQLHHLLSQLHSQHPWRFTVYMTAMVARVRVNLWLSAFIASCLTDFKKARRQGMCHASFHPAVLLSLPGINFCWVCSEALHSAFQQVDNDFERNLVALQQAAVAAERERRSSCYSQALPTPSSTPRSPMIGAAPPFGDPPAFTVSAERRESTSTPFSFGAGFTGGSLGDFDNPEALDDQSGCTAVAALLSGNLQTGGSITVANAGDSRVVLCREAKAVPLSMDHKAKRQDERARILWAGGMIMRGRVLGRLAVTRAIGDLSLKRGAGEQYLVTAEPEVFELPLSSTDEFLIVACDGIWDVMESQEAVDFVRHELVRGATCEAAAKALAKRAFELGSADNLTAVVVVLGDGPVESIAAVVSPPPIAAAIDAEDEKNDFLDKLLESVAGPSRYGTPPVPSLAVPAPSAAPVEDPVPVPVAMAPVPPTASAKKARGPNPFARATRRAAGEHVSEKAVPVNISGDTAAPPPAPAEEASAALEETPAPLPEAPKQKPTYGRRAVRPEGSRSPAPNERRSPSPAASPVTLPPLAIQEAVKPTAPLRNSFPERLPPRQYHGGSYISLLPLASGASGKSRRDIQRLPSTILSPASADAAIAATAAAIQATSRTTQQEPFHSLTTDALTMAVGSRGDSVGTAMARLGRARTLLSSDNQSRRGGSWSLPPPHARFGSMPQGSDLISNLRVGIPLSKIGDDSKSGSPALQEHGRAQCTWSARSSSCWCCH